MKPDLTLIVTIAGILVAIIIGGVTIYYQIKAKDDAWKIPERQGAFRKPNIGFAVFDCKVGIGYPDNEDWFFIHPGKSEDVAVFPIKFTIYNSGDRVTGDILVTIQVPKSIFLKSQMEGTKRSTYPSLLNEDIKQSFDEIGNFTVISFAIPPLSPNQTFSLVIPFTLTPTLKNFSVPLEVYGQKIKPHIQTLYANIIAVSIFSGDAPPSTYQLRIGALSASNIIDGVQKFVALEPKLSKKNIFVRIYELFKYTTEWEVTNFVSFDIESQTRYKKHKFFLMKLPDDFYRGGWLPSNDTSELHDLTSGHIVGIMNLKPILRSERKVRYKEGNLVQER